MELVDRVRHYRRIDSPYRAVVISYRDSHRYWQGRSGASIRSLALIAPYGVHATVAWPSGVA
jgi:hypothetical protein